MNSTTHKYFDPKSIPFIFLAVIISGLAGSFFGRINTITCDKNANSCSIISRGYLYTVYNESVAISEIEGVHVQCVRDEAPVMYSRSKYGPMKRPDLDFYSLLIDRGIEKPLKIIPPVEVPVHDILSYSLPLFEVSDSLTAFLGNPSQNDISLTFGTHRTGYIFTLTIFALLAYLLYSRFFWRFTYTQSKDKVTRDFMDGSGSEEFIDRTSYRINIKRGNGDVFNGIAYLVDGSTILFENGFKVKHPFKKKPEKFGSTEISKDLPVKIKDKIVALKA